MKIAGFYENMREKELAFLLFLQEVVRGRRGNVFWPLVTGFGNGAYGWFVLCGALSVLPLTREAAARSFLTIVLGELLVNIVIKLIFRRKRPYEVCPELTVIGRRMHDTSFPSGHTCIAFLMFFTFLGTMPWWFCAGVFVAAAMIAFSRMYLGVHYPSDIAGGIVIAWGIAKGLRVWVFPVVSEWGLW